MMMIRPKALFLDIDGTILQSDHSLSERVTRAVRSLANANVLVTPATGRSWEALKPLYDELGLTGPSVCYNGAYVFEGSGGRRIAGTDMEEEVGRYIIELAREKGMEMLAYRNGQLLYERVGREIEVYHSRVLLRGNLVNFDDFDELTFAKCIILSSKGDLEHLQETLEERFPPERLYATYSDPSFLEIHAGGVNKGRGLREVCRIHGIAVSDTAALGDGWNDLPLLEAAGSAWVMGNAMPNLKAKFPPDRVLPSSDEDGAALVMEAMLEERDPILPDGLGS